LKIEPLNSEKKESNWFVIRSNWQSYKRLKKNIWSWA